jgi:signal transduction histidine kinase
MRDIARLRVLLVEDNPLDARAMKRILAMNTETDFVLSHAEDLSNALQLLENEAFDCILLDLSLPDSQGLLAIDKVVAQSPQAPIVVLTGLDDPTTALEAVDRGAHDFLPKGRVDGDMVARSMRYAVARHHAELSLRDTTKKLEVASDRGRIARDLHDTVVQQLFATGMSLQALASSTTDAASRDQLIEAIDQIDVGIRQLREAIFDLHLVEDDDDETYEIDELVRSKVPVLGFSPTLTKRNVDDLSPTLVHEVVAVIGEALSNITKHARATSAEVSVIVEAGLLKVEITDNGQGISDGRRAICVDDLTGHGLRSMANRAATLGGDFSLHPGPGGGTRVVWTVPSNARRKG